MILLTRPERGLIGLISLIRLMRILGVERPRFEGRRHSGVFLVSLDFLKKELVLGKEFLPTGYDKQDILSIREYYNTFTPKNPANF